MAQKLTVNLETGDQELVDLSPAEAAELAALAASFTQATAQNARRAAFLAAATPDAALLQKVRDGTAPTAGELWRLVRWLVAREYLEAMAE